LRLGFAGTPRFALPALNALLKSRHGVVAVFTQPDRPAGRGQNLKVSPVKELAEQQGLAVYQPASLKTTDAAALVQHLELDALIVVAYGLILPVAVLALPRMGCFNIHASLLPRWRGAAPIQRALLAGDALTGISIMRMEAGLDTGPILLTGKEPILDKDTGATLHDRLAAMGARLMLETLDALARGTARAMPQAGTGITYAEKIDKAEARIDWNDAAADICRKVRAFNPWPIAATTLDGVGVRIWDAEVAAAGEQAGLTRGVADGLGAPPGSVLLAANAGIEVACGVGTLRILRLQLAGRRALTAAEFIKAAKLSGVRFASP
jgi:methionyl-tRNA formyltransferase